MHAARLLEGTEVVVKVQRPGSTVGVAAVTALLNTFTAHGLGVPPSVAAVFRAVTTLEQGRLRFNVVIGAAAGLMATLLLGTGGGPRVSTGVALFPLLGYGLLVVSVVLVLRVLVTIFRHD